MNPIIDKLRPHLNQATEADRRATQALTANATAKANLAKTRDTYGLQLTQEAAEAYLAAEEHEHRTRLLAEAVDDAGGPSEARLRVLMTDAVYDLLADGFRHRIETLNQLLIPARKAVANAVAELVAEGLNATLASVHPSIIGLRQRLASLEGQRQAADAALGYCTARPIRRERKFDSLLAELMNPIT